MTNLIVENTQQPSKDDIYPIIYANRGMRFVASLINAVVFWVAFAMGGIFAGGERETIGIWIAAAILFCFAVQIFSMYKYKQTLGKKCCGLIVVDYNLSRPLGFGRYILREIVELVGGQFGLGLINAICAFINKERRTLTDLIFSTIVIRVNK